MKMKRIFNFFAAFAFGVLSISAQNVIDFEELSLEPNSHWNGSDMSGSFTSKWMKFYNEFTDWGGGMYSWSGFAYTNETDTETFSYLNEYSSASGSGNNNSANYTVAYVMSDWMNNYEPIPVSAKIDRSQMAETISGMYISLNTYSSLYMDADNIYQTGKHWYKMMITAYNTTTNSEISREFILADYRFENIEPLKLNDWTFIDMQWTGDADSLTFSVYTSDFGDWGPNTPSYFCLDDINGGSGTSIPFEEEIQQSYDITAGESVELKALVKGGVQPYNFEWNIEGNTLNTQTVSVAPLETTYYYVTVNDAIGNQVIKTVVVNVNPTSIIQNKIFVHLNIENDNLIISSEKNIGLVKIYDITGKLILENIIENTNSSINISKLSGGVYIVSIPNLNITQKIFK